MGIGSRKGKKSKKLKKSQRDSAVNSIAGIAEAGFLAAASDGVLTEEEMNALASVLDSLFDGEASAKQIRKIINACAEALDEEGFEGRMDGIADLLPDDDSRYAALMTVASVIMSDDDFDPDNEGEYYDDLADRIGVDEDTALEIWNDIANEYGWN
jgi:uncharacterized membrane protein YebE (DUF533 family)